MVRPYQKPISRRFTVPCVVQTILDRLMLDASSTLGQACGCNWAHQQVCPSLFGRSVSQSMSAHLDFEAREALHQRRLLPLQVLLLRLQLQPVGLHVTARRSR